MIEAGKTYRTRRGQLAKVYDIAPDRFNKRLLAIGAFFDGDDFISAEYWDASNGQYQITGDPCGMDLIAEPNLADLIPSFVRQSA